MLANKLAAAINDNVKGCITRLEQQFADIIQEVRGELERMFEETYDDETEVALRRQLVELLPALKDGFEDIKFDLKRIRRLYDGPVDGT